MGAALRFSFPSLLTALAWTVGAPTYADAPRALVGSWLGRLGGRPLTLDLRADGTFSMGEMEGACSASGSELLLDDEPLWWRLDGGALLLTDAAGQTVRWVRQGAPRSCRTPAGAPTPAEQARKTAAAPT